MCVYTQVLGDLIKIREERSHRVCVGGCLQAHPVARDMKPSTSECFRLWGGRGVWQ